MSVVLAIATAVVGGSPDPAPDSRSVGAVTAPHAGTRALESNQRCGARVVRGVRARISLIDPDRWRTLPRAT